jgi:hypothetical protein
MTPHLCRHLRTKKLFTGSPPEEAFREKEPEEASPTHYWCNLTQSVVGADDQPTHPTACVPGRSCFQE